MRSLKHILLIVWLVLMTAMTVSGRSLPSAVIKLQSRTVTVEQFFAAIESQTRCYVVFSEGQINPQTRLTFSRMEADLSVFVNEFSQSQSLKYDYSRRYIVFSRYVTRQSIRGRVIDQNGSPVYGAAITQFAGKSIGAVSRSDGSFEVKVGPGTKLSVSCLGFHSIVVTASAGMTIVLHEEIGQLEEVVVVGYGTQKKINLTGAITSLKSSDLDESHAISVSEAIQGKVAGAYVNKGRGVGASSDIFIRGVGSVNGLKPLYVIDGMPGGDETGININDIKSIDVVKDASAAAIYGANAAGGVILISTKSGESGEPRIDFSSKIGVSASGKSYRFLGTQDYIAARKETTGTYDSLWDSPGGLPDTDWARELGFYGTGLDQQYTLSVSGGQGRFNTYVSGMYSREDGLQEDFWQSMSYLVKTEYSLSPGVKVGARISGRKINYDDNTVGWRTFWRSIPYMSVRDSDGSFTSIPSSTPFTACKNHVAELAYGDHQRKGSFVSDSRLYLDWNIAEGLKFNVTGLARLGSSYSNTYQEATLTRKTNISDLYKMYDRHGEDYRFFATLSFDKSFGMYSHIEAMAGYESYYGMSNYVSASGSGSSVSDPQSISMTSANSRTGGGVFDANGRSLSQFARVNYDYKDRYLLTLNVRRDGSSKFGPTHRFGIFPSASVGWKLSDEPFFRALGAEWVSLVKPRISYGVLGNTDALGAYTWQAAYSSDYGSYSFDGMASGRVSGITMNKVINSDIKWEEIRTMDAGLDFILFSGRFEGGFDWYDRRSVDMLYNMRVPSTSGVSGTMPINLGSISNRGVELSLKWSDRLGELHYSIGANLSHNENLVLNIGEINSEISTGLLMTTNDNSTLSTCYGTHYTVNGQPLGQIWGFRTEGIISSEEELDALNALALANGHPCYQTTQTGVGDLRYADIDGDGHITKDDAAFIGNPWPKWQLGGSVSLCWRGFDLEASFIGILGRDVVNCMKPFEYMFQTDYQTTYKIFDTSFFGDNGLTAYPRVYSSEGDVTVMDPNGNYNVMSDFLVEDASFFKVKNLTFGYTLPYSVSSRAGMDKCRVYFNGNNLLTFTRFTGLEPEFTGSVTEYGTYRESNPLMRVYTLGVNIVFKRGGLKR